MNPINSALIQRTKLPERVGPFMRFFTNDQLDALLDAARREAAAVEMFGPTTERYAEAAFNEGWRDREARAGRILNSRSEMRKAWLDSNARDAILEGVDPDEH